jgi:type IV secretory pathway VirB2 component (pilin)
MIQGAPTTDGSTLLRAAQWVDTLIQRPVVTSLAVLAMAAVGLAMLSGRIAVRRGATVALGCFLTFGASAITHGIFAAATYPPDVEATTTAAAIEPPPPVFEIPAKPERPVVNDPYAGASVTR